MIGPPLLITAVLVLLTACGPVDEVCGNYCGEIRILFEAPCGSQGRGTPADCAAWVGKVSTMARRLDTALSGKPVEAGVKDSLPTLLRSVASFESHGCADVKVGNEVTTDDRHDWCNHALITTRGDLSSLYFAIQRSG